MVNLLNTTIFLLDFLNLIYLRNSKYYENLKINIKTYDTKKRMKHLKVFPQKGRLT